MDSFQYLVDKVSFLWMEIFRNCIHFKVVTFWFYAQIRLSQKLLFIFMIKTNLLYLMLAQIILRSYLNVFTRLCCIFWKFLYYLMYISGLVINHNYLNHPMTRVLFSFSFLNVFDQVHFLIILLYLNHYFCKSIFSISDQS